MIVDLNMFITHEHRFSVLTKSEDSCGLELETNLLAMLFEKSLKM